MPQGLSGSLPSKLKSLRGHPACTDHAVHEEPSTQNVLELPFLFTREMDLRPLVKQAPSAPSDTWFPSLEIYQINYDSACSLVLWSNCKFPLARKLSEKLISSRSLSLVLRLKIWKLQKFNPTSNGCKALGETCTFCSLWQLISLLGNLLNQLWFSLSLILWSNCKFLLARNS